MITKKQTIAGLFGCCRALRWRSFSVFAILFTVFFLNISPAHAVCTDPDGEAGDQVYNTTYNIMQYCNGTSWISMNGGAVTKWGDSATPGNIFYQDGDVGIGIANPLTALHVFGVIRVDGALRLANQGAVVDCAAQNIGDIRYNTGTGKIEACDGAGAWVASTGGFTLGAVPFANGDGDLVEDPTNLLWDAVNNALRVGRKIQFVGLAGDMPVGTSVVAEQPTPAPIVFTNYPKVDLNTPKDSDAVVLSGFVGTVLAYCNGGCSAIARNGTWGSNVAIFLPGDTIAIRQTSSASYDTTTSASVTVGGTTSANWEVTTILPTDVQSWGAGSHTWTKPPGDWTYGTTNIYCVGGGGGGAGGSACMGGGSSWGGYYGNPGGITNTDVGTATLAATQAVTVGYGGGGSGWSGSCGGFNGPGGGGSSGMVGVAMAGGGGTNPSAYSHVFDACCAPGGPAQGSGYPGGYGNSGAGGDAWNSWFCLGGCGANNGNGGQNGYCTITTTDGTTH